MEHKGQIGTWLRVRPTAAQMENRFSNTKCPVAKALKKRFPQVKHIYVAHTFLTVGKKNFNFQYSGPARKMYEQMLLNEDNSPFDLFLPSSPNDKIRYARMVESKSSASNTVIHKGQLGRWVRVRPTPTQMENRLHNTECPIAEGLKQQFPGKDVHVAYSYVTVASVDFYFDNESPARKTYDKMLHDGDVTPFDLFLPVKIGQAIRYVRIPRIRKAA